MTGNLKELTERLREQTETERREMEKIITAELSNLKENLRSAAKSALYTIKSDMEREAEAMKKAALLQMKILSWNFGRLWLMTAAIALAVMLGLAGGGLGLMKLAEYRINALHKEWANLSLAKAQAEITLSQLKAHTWGLILHEAPNGRFIILPKGAKPQTGWTINGGPAVKVE